MMKMKTPVLLSILTLVMMACSESGYTPANTQPTQVAPGGYNSAVQPPYVNGPTPTLPIRPMSTFTAPSLQANAQAGFQFNWQTSPYYYLKNTTANCSLRRQADYTNDRCACYQAPCNCAAVVEQVRARCANRPRATTRGSCTVANPTCGTDAQGAQASVAAITSTVSNTVSPSITVTPSSAAVNSPNTELTPPTLPASVANAMSATIDEAAGLVLWSTHGATAKALYERLAKKSDEEKDSQGETIHVIRGQNYKCSMAKVGFLASREKKEKAYHCGLDIGSTLGLVKMQSPVSADGPRILKTSEPVVSETLRVGGQNLQADEGMITIKGTQATLFYDALNTKAKLGMMVGDSTTQGNVKTLGHLKCSRTLNESAKSECQIKINTMNGAAIDAS